MTSGGAAAANGGAAAVNARRAPRNVATPAARRIRRMSGRAPIGHLAAELRAPAGQHGAERDATNAAHGRGAATIVTRQQRRSRRPRRPSGAWESGRCRPARGWLRMGEMRQGEWRWVRLTTGLFITECSQFGLRRTPEKRVEITWNVDY